MENYNELRDYEIIVSQEENADGKYFIAKINELETIGDGVTREEAIKCLLEISENAILIAKERGLKIPKPEKRKCSGTISLRMPKFLHEKISGRAKLEQVSINQLIVSALSWFLGAKETESEKIVVHNHYNNNYTLHENEKPSTDTWRYNYERQYC